MDEEKFSKGAIVDTPDARDYQFADAVVALGLAPFDWESGYDIEEIIGKTLEVKDQNGSGSCGGQAWGYYGEALDPDHEQKSAKFVYAHTFVLPAGSSGRTNCELVINKGWGSEELTPSYDNGNPPSEAFMQRVSDITEEAYKQALSDKGLSYVNVSNAIDTVAQAIANNSGCIIGIAGKNNGTWISKFPVPPTDVVGAWNHWMYCGKAKIINGKKYIGALNSWGEDVGEKGWQWFSEDYFKYPFIWSVWTMMYDFPKPKHVFKKTLRYRSKGEEVKQLQMRLNIDIEAGLVVDGSFGMKTKRAVINFQTSHGLVGDGIVGPLTNKVLNN